MIYGEYCRHAAVTVLQCFGDDAAMIHYTKLSRNVKSSMMRYHNSRCSDNFAMLFTWHLFLNFTMIQWRCHQTIVFQLQYQNYPATQRCRSAAKRQHCAIKSNWKKKAYDYRQNPDYCIVYWEYCLIIEIILLHLMFFFLGKRWEIITSYGKRHLHHLIHVPTPKHSLSELFTLIITAFVLLFLLPNDVPSLERHKALS